MRALLVVSKAQATVRALSIRKAGATTLTLLAVSLCGPEPGTVWRARRAVAFYDRRQDTRAGAMRMNHRNPNLCGSTLVHLRPFRDTSSCTLGVGLLRLPVPYRSEALWRGSWRAITWRGRASRGGCRRGSGSAWRRWLLVRYTSSWTSASGCFRCRVVQHRHRPEDAARTRPQGRGHLPRPRPGYGLRVIRHR